MLFSNTLPIVTFANKLLHSLYSATVEISCDFFYPFIPYPIFSSSSISPLKYFLTPSKKYIFNYNLASPEYIVLFYDMLLFPSHQKEPLLWNYLLL